MPDIRPASFVVGWLLILLGAGMAFPSAIDLVDGNPNASAFLASMLLTVTAGAAIALACGPQRAGSLDLRQGFLLVTLAWLGLTGFATLPLMLGARAFGGGRLADLGQVRGHRRGVAPGHDQPGALALLRTDRAEDVCPFGPLVVRGAGSRAAFRLASGDGGLLPDAGFVLPPQLYLGSSRKPFADLVQLDRKSF